MREVEGTVERIGGQGDGVMTTAQGRFYVPYTVPGDRVRVRVGKAKGAGHAAELSEVIAPGPDRVEPPCPHFHACGGCALQQLAPAAYAAWKRESVVAALARQGLDSSVVAPLVATPPGTRRRAEFVARRVGMGVLVGFHEAGSRRIVDLGACLVLHPRLVALLAPLRALLLPLLQPGASVDAKATLADNGADLVLSGPLESGGPARMRLADFATALDLARLTLEARSEAPGDKVGDTVVERRQPIIAFAGISVVLPPGGFVQASPAAEAVLVAESLTVLAGQGRIADLYSGLGTFALPLARAGAMVRAFDADAPALAALRAAAIGAGLSPRLEVEARDLARRPLPAVDLDRFDAVLFDPPRAGAPEQAKEIARSRVALAVGVSCDATSFARDARHLTAGGFRLERVVPVDQFLWTPQVELVGVFRR
jgi:23S rRNA (uracil1939-C5)-methyltransferase